VFTVLLTCASCCLGSPAFDASSIAQYTFQVLSGWRELTIHCCVRRGGVRTPDGAAAGNRQRPPPAPGLAGPPVSHLPPARAAAAAFVASISMSFGLSIRRQFSEAAGPSHHCKPSCLPRCRRRC